MKTELDISIFDRLNVLFYSSPFSDFMTKGSNVNDFIGELSPSSQKIVQAKTEVKLTSECLHLVLRFPIVDMRPLHDPEKNPWWQRNVRPDSLLLKFNVFRLNYISPSIYDLMANEINIYYNVSVQATRSVITVIINQ